MILIGFVLCNIMWVFTYLKISKELERIVIENIKLRIALEEARKITFSNVSRN